MKKVVLYDESYISSLPEVFIQKKNSYGELIIYFTFILIISLLILISFIKIDDVVKVQGVVKTQENISEVKNVISGKMINKNYFTGKVVKKDELLFEIDNSSLYSQLEIENEFLNLVTKELSVLKNILLLLDNNKSKFDEYKKETMLIYDSYTYQVKKIEKEIEINKNFYNDEISKPSNITNLNSIRDKKNQVEYLEIGLNEFKSNYKNQLVQNIKNYEKQFLECKNNIKNITAEIDKTKILAPVDGVVQEVLILNQGDYIFSSQCILKIIPQIEQMYNAHLYLKSSDVGKISEGLKVKLRFPAYPFYEYDGLTGKIEILDPDTTVMNYENYYKIVCKFDDISLKDKSGKNYQLRSGLDVDARIIVDRKTILKFLLKKLDLDL